MPRQEHSVNRRGLRASLLLFLSVPILAAGPPETIKNTKRSTPRSARLEGDRKPQTTRSLRPTSSSRAEKTDSPELAARHFQVRRVGDEAPVSPENYDKPSDQLQDLPQYATALGTAFPSRRQVENTPGLSSAIEPLRLATWTFVGPSNVGGRVRALAVHPSNDSILYAGAASGGVWNSTDQGATWNALASLSANMANLSVCALVLDRTTPTRIYAGTGEGVFGWDAVRGDGIYRSDDAGATWWRVSPGIGQPNRDQFYYINKLVQSTQNPARLYAATRTGIWRTENANVTTPTWTRLLASTANGGFTDLAIRIDTASGADVLLASEGVRTSPTNTQVFRSTDSGANWTLVLPRGPQDNQMDRTALAFSPTNGTHAYAVSAKNTDSRFYKLFASTDAGATWQERADEGDLEILDHWLLSNPSDICAYGQLNSQGTWDISIAVDPAPVAPPFDTVWVGGVDLFQSVDGGFNFGIASHWELGPPINTAPLEPSQWVHGDHHALVFSPTSPHRLFVGNDGGVFTTDHGEYGADYSYGPPSCGYASTVPWVRRSNGLSVTQFYHGASYPDGVTILGGTQDNGTVRGNSPTWSYLWGGDGGFVAVNPQDTNIVFVENQAGRIRRTTDGGSSWLELTSPTDSYLFLAPPFVLDAANPTHLWRGGTHAWQSTDSGTTWSDTNGGVPITIGTERIVTAIAVSQAEGNPPKQTILMGASKLGVSHGEQAAVDSGIYYYDPAAQPRWKAALGSEGNLGYVSSLACDPRDRDICYATYSSFGATHLRRSTNAGVTWQTWSSPTLPDVPVNSVVVSPFGPQLKLSTEPPNVQCPQASKCAGQHLYLGTDLGILASTDGGGNWMTENTGFANASVYWLTINQSAGQRYLFAFSHGRGAYRVPLCQTAPTITSYPTTYRVNQTTCPGGGQTTAGTALRALWYKSLYFPGAFASTYVYEGTNNWNYKAFWEGLSGWLNSAGSASTCGGGTASRRVKLNGAEIKEDTVIPVGSNTITFEFYSNYGMVSTSAALDVTLQGDVDLSGAVDVMDAVLIAAFMVGNQRAGQPSFYANTIVAETADSTPLQYDSTIDIFDLIRVQSFIAGNIVCLTPALTDQPSPLRPSSRIVSGAAEAVLGTPKRSGKLGSTYSVPLRIDLRGVLVDGLPAELGGYVVRLEYDPKALTLVGVDPGGAVGFRDAPAFTVSERVAAGVPARVIGSHGLRRGPSGNVDVAVLQVQERQVGGIGSLRVSLEQVATAYEQGIERVGAK